MAENLKTAHYSNGDEVDYYIYNNDSSIGETYGYLYNWNELNDERGICPEGFHIPSDDEYTILTDYLGGNNTSGKMKEAGLEHWCSPNSGAINESGFTALPAGYRHFTNGYYNYMGYAGYFWSSSEYISTNA